VTGTRFNIVSSGRSVPSGPLGAPTLAGGGGRQSPVPRVRNNRSKKGYTGSRAGVGRMNTAHGTVARSGPQGPRGFGHSVQLPARGKIGAADRKGVPTVQFRGAPASPRPSLMTRIGRKLRSRVAAFGF
jgi:hypothetical protein